MHDHVKEEDNLTRCMIMQKIRQHDTMYNHAKNLTKKDIQEQTE